jgi:hypothetical protein
MLVTIFFFILLAMNSTKSFYLLVIILSIILVSCSDNEKLPGSEQILLFEIDDKLLSDSVQLPAYNLKFNPPKNWEPISKGLFDSLVQKIQTQQLSDSIKIIPLHVFFSELNQSILNVSAVEIQSSNLENTIDQFEQREIDKAGIQNFKRADFVKDSLSVTQFLIEENNLIIFKIFVRINQNRIAEFDYIVPKNIYAGEIKSIESSIGSIKLTNK